MKTYITILLCVCSIYSYGQGSISVKLHSIKGYESYGDFAAKAINKLEETINSDKFKQFVKDGKFTKTNGMSNDEILKTIIKAHELQGEGGKDNVIDLRLRTITLETDGKKWMKNCQLDSWAGTIGIDGSGDGIAAICPQRLMFWSEKNDLGSLAGHYMHEYMHILGFSHHGLYKSKSAVYKIGYLVRDLINGKI